MDISRKILLAIGSMFAGIGLIVFITMLFLAGVKCPFAILPLIFVIIGVAMDVSVLISYSKEKSIKTKGKRYSAKIYSYVEDKSVVVNGDFLMNVVVHYWDSQGVEKETIIPTKFAKGASEYPIGMTIDIFEYKGLYNFDKDSVRNEKLYREEELMDDKPIDRAAIKMIAISCKNCGSTYEAVEGYTAKCPYCSTYINA